MRTRPTAGLSRWIRILATASVLLGGAAGVRGGAAVEVPLELGAPATAPVAADFLGLSFEMERLLPDAAGRHFFRPDNEPLLATFRTLGIRSLRVGGNTADRPSVPVPAAADLDAFFGFARRAGVKVIFTLRLRDSDPRAAAAVAKHIVDRHADVLRCFAIGNEPNVFAPEYPEFLAAWRRFAAVVNAPEFAPAAHFAGPSSTAGKTEWTRDFARDLVGTGRLLVATQHLYPGGNADLVGDPAVGRDRMLSREWVRGYETFHAGFAPAVLAVGVPYRLGETNSFWNGGLAGASDTFAAALWALDYAHWWAAHGAEGLNFHTGDFVAKAEENTRCRYAAFWSAADGIEAKPVAYALKAFALGGGGRSVPVALPSGPDTPNLTAYAYRDGEVTTVTVINKEHGGGARDTAVALRLPAGATALLLRLVAPGGDVAATEGIALGGAAIARDGTWSGAWSDAGSADATGRLIVTVPAASAALVRIVPAAGAPSPVRPGAPVEAGPIPALPPLAPLFDHPVRDTSICVGHDGAYYLTGTTGWPDMWGVTGDIQVWRSEDLANWRPVVEKPFTRSVVWNADREGTWEKRIPQRKGAPFRPLWAPEIAYLKGTYWLCYSFPLGVGGGLLKSTSGRPEGPYERVFKDGPAVDAIDLALFADDDGKVYLVWGAGNIRQLNDTMDGFVGEGWKLRPAGAERIGFEGTFVFKANGRYYITGAEFVPDPAGGPAADYHCYAAVGDSLRGPFGEKFLAIPHAGHNSFFRDRAGQWWATFFGNDPRAPFRERPGILRIEFAPDGRFTFAQQQPPFILAQP